MDLSISQLQHQNKIVLIKGCQLALNNPKISRVAVTNYLYQTVFQSGNSFSIDEQTKRNVIQNKRNFYQHHGHVLHFHELSSINQIIYLQQTLKLIENDLNYKISRDDVNQYPNFTVNAIKNINEQITLNVLDQVNNLNLNSQGEIIGYLLTFVGWDLPCLYNQQSTSFPINQSDWETVNINIKKHLNPKHQKNFDLVLMINYQGDAIDEYLNSCGVSVTQKQSIIDMIIQQIKNY